MMQKITAAKEIFWRLLQPSGKAGRNKAWYCNGICNNLFLRCLHSFIVGS
jgi:hypothetical protein